MKGYYLMYRGLYILTRKRQPVEEVVETEHTVGRRASPNGQPNRRVSTSPNSSVKLKSHVAVIYIHQSDQNLNGTIRRRRWRIDILSYCWWKYELFSTFLKEFGNVLKFKTACHSNKGFHNWNLAHKNKHATCKDICKVTLNIQLKTK